MVSPFLPIVITLGAVFLIAILGRLKLKERDGAIFAAGLFYITAAALIVIPAMWLPLFVSGPDPVVVIAAGPNPLLTMRLQIGTVEAILLVFVNMVALFGALSMQQTLVRRAGLGYALYLMTMLGVNGLILAQDLIAVVVFLGIMSVGTYGVAAWDKTTRQPPLNSRHLLAGGIALTFVLAGTVILYRLTGTLSFDEIIAGGDLLSRFGPAGFMAAFLLIVGILIELKSMPTGGWAVDAYQTGNCGLSSLISAGNATAVIFVLYNLLPLLPDSVVGGLLWVGVLTFGIANLIGLTQTEALRVLGYSSVAQIGLIAAVLAIIQLEGLSQTYVFIVAGGLLVNHLLSKGGLFWIAGAFRKSGRTRPVGPVVAGGAVVLGLALIGLPPFPAFWAKWQLVNTLIATARIGVLLLFVAGSVIEAICILRWFGRRGLRIDQTSGPPLTSAATQLMPIAGTVPDGAVLERTRLTPGTGIGVLLVASLSGIIGILVGWILGVNDPLIAAPYLLATATLFFEWLPSRFRALLAVAAIVGYAYLIYPLATGLALIFGAIFVAGGLVAVISRLNGDRSAFGEYPLYVLAVTALTGLVVASEPVTFFVLWQLMAIGSCLLIVRSERAATVSLGLLVGGAMLIMTGLVVALQGFIVGEGGVALPEIFGADGYVRLPALTGGWPANAGAVQESTGAAARVVGIQVTGLGMWGAEIPTRVRFLAFVLIGSGFLATIGATVMRIRVPDGRAEPEYHLTPHLSPSLRGAGIFGMLTLLLMVGAPAAGGDAVNPGTLLGWVGAGTALIGALMAASQDDLRKLLACTTISQTGYMLLGFSVATAVGWVSGAYLMVIHFISMVLLFVGMACIIHRTGTSKMSEMGGLIGRMPITFVAVLVSIMVLSGLPPLAGIGGKWLIASALIGSRWYLQAGIALLASIITILYLSRMVKTVFLGTEKSAHQTPLEAPTIVLLPLLILTSALMLISMYPSIILGPAMSAVEPFFSSTVLWQGYAVIAALGYWNGSIVMYVTMGIFVLLMILGVRRPSKLSLIATILGGGRRSLPDMARLAHNLYGYYRKSLSIFAAPAVVHAQRPIAAGFSAINSAIRLLYIGDGWRQVVVILLFTVVLYLVTGGV